MSCQNLRSKRQIKSSMVAIVIVFIPTKMQHKIDLIVEAARIKQFR